ncbi:MAG TPA: lipocalin family protein [Nitrospira sp.]|jgi:apolipoprotein D and lipocalin family protein
MLKRSTGGYGSLGPMLSRQVWVGSGHSPARALERGTTNHLQRSAAVRLTSKLLALGGFGLAAIGLAACSTLVSRHPIGNRSVPQPNKPVDLQKYLGRWYEIARYEQSFQKGCEGVTADYSLRADGSIDVINRCRKPDGKSSEARGHAKVVDDETKAKLKVSFFGPFYGNYWVLDHADDYGWSIVGEPSGRYLWILNRDATPAEVEVQRLIDRAKDLGYDTSMLLRTKQP